MHAYTQHTYVYAGTVRTYVNTDTVRMFVRTHARKNDLLTQNNADFKKQNRKEKTHGSRKTQNAALCRLYKYRLTLLSNIYLSDFCF
jgi:hypothetical protein